MDYVSPSPGGLRFPVRHWLTRFRPATLVLLLLGWLGEGRVALAQCKPANDLLAQSSIIGTIGLLVLVVLFVAFIAIVRLGRVFQQLNSPMVTESEGDFDETVANLSAEQLTKIVQRRQSIAYRLAGDELAGVVRPLDERGIINHASTDVHAPLVAAKKKTFRSREVDPQLTKLIGAFLLTATFWLVFGTPVGWYVGIKFVRPDIDHVAWLSFGRLRPVHTKAVFWGICYCTKVWLASASCSIPPKSMSFNPYKNHRLFVSTVFAAYMALSVLIAVAPARSVQENNAPLPGVSPQNGEVQAGLHVFVKEGCVACHTQRVRNIDMDKT